ncbi:uncharacterized protein EURHEDRAFT_376462 [Aspergillus ruber CBS 135680]|uniref:Uncharacterized protein n=1 Tax=Aspergillus ruber (strain CBS 135680) TaxID=1388766 RepID=A0A017SIH5_ASPRC|nr:uncharacterized protein EURHEDRAFT_376462 [Aspergillus ruber CBS 135680]EYE96531.1 hypothetical protein EURHEDRAFT_376462 [Aspergillus ruber CBS 135680]
MGLMRTAWIEHPELHLPLIDRGEGETAQKALRPGSGAEGRTRMRSETGVGVGSIRIGSFPSLDSDLSIVLPVAYLFKTIVTAMTQELSRKISRDHDFINTHVLSLGHSFKMIIGAGAGHEAVPSPSGGSRPWLMQPRIQQAHSPISPSCSMVAWQHGRTRQ